VVGQGDDEERLKKLCCELRLSNISFLGRVTEQDKCRILQRAWIAVNPSSVEGWGLCNTEAHACGTPVVASNVPGNRDSVVDGRNGILFRSGDEVDLASRIDHLLGDSHARHNMSRHAVAWSKHFCWDRTARDFLDEIECAVSNPLTGSCPPRTDGYHSWNRSCKLGKSASMP
jgi:glycosyltransferase involved in cell wall biosynthesis